MSAEQGNDNILQDQLKAAEKINRETAKMQRIQDAYQKKQDSQLDRQLKISRITEERTTKRILLDDRLQKQRRMLEVGTRMGGALGGGVGGSIFGFIQQIASMKAMNYSQKKDELAEQNKRFKMTGAVAGLSAKPEKTLLGKLDKTIDRVFGTGSKWDKMFGGHGRMAAMGGGLAAAGAGLALTKAIIDSSMMLQQMLKLLKFGVMLILKPIGDFFGFLMRPILILLLRKFIIPFYQKVYPWFATTGNKIGTDIAKVLDQLSEVGVIPIALGGLAAAIGTAIAGKKVFQGLFKGFTETQMTKFANIIGKSIENKGTTPIPQRPPVVQGGKFIGGTTTSGGTFMGRDDPMKNKTLSKYSSNPAVKKVQKFIDRINDIKIRRPDIPQSQIQSQITEFMDKQKGGGANGIIDKLKRVLTSSKFLNKIGGTLAKGGFWGLAHELMLDMFNINIRDGDYDPSTDPANMMAKGGIIREPIKGIGQRTGQSYLLGESGSEAVIPMNKMGGMGGTTTVNISIGNMSGNANDLNKLRSTILEVMQTVNVNRGR